MSWVRLIIELFRTIAGLVKEGRARKADQETKTELSELANEVEAKDDERTRDELRDILGG